MRHDSIIQLSRRSLLMLSAAAGYLVNDRAAAAEPTTLTVAVVPEPQGLIGTLAVSAPAVTISTSIFDGLVTYDDQGRPVPSLAESWEQSADHRTITFHLRRDVTWHDGQPFTSADVRYTLLQVMKTVHPRGNAYLAALTDVQTPDDHTAIFVLSRPSPLIWTVLGSDEIQILPRHLYENTNPLTNPWNAKPVGTGAFVFKSWARGDSVLVERNPRYWQKGRPVFDRVRFRFIPDAGVRVAALETGEVQYVPLSPVPLSDVTRLRGEKDLVVETRGWDFSAPMLFTDFNMRRPKFQDVRVRQAIAHAIDRQKLADTVWYGLADPATGPVPSYQKQSYTPDTQQYAFDPDQATKLLDAAGLRPDSDGIRLRIDHAPMPYGDDYLRTGEFIRQSLKHVGIDVTLRSYDLPTFLRVVFTDGDFDTFNSFYAAFSDPQIGVQRRFWSKAIKKGTPWGNGSGYANAEMDQIIEAIQTEGDPAARTQLIHRMQQKAQNDLPSLTLLELKFFRVFSSRLGGIDVGPDGGYQSLAPVGYRA